MNPFAVIRNYVVWFGRYKELERAYRAAPGANWYGGQFLWFPAWVHSVTGDRSAVSQRLPWLTFGSLPFLRRSVRPGLRVAEFGMGGSTLFFTDHGCSLLSFEHDDVWSGKVRELVKGSADWKMHLIPPSSGSGQAVRVPSGFPGYETSDFQSYVSAIDSEPDESFDIILVDGRARVEAMEHSMPKLKSGGLLILDNSERPRYEPIHTKLRDLCWPVRHFPGPTPCVKREFTQTTIWTKP